MGAGTADAQDQPSSPVSTPQIPTMDACASRDLDHRSNDYGRKRAKTEDEKEQRRIERVLRNRAAAQSSRERKRKEVEGLEEEKEAIRRQNALLTSQLRRVEMENQELSKTIAKMAAEMSVFRQMIHGDLPTPPSDVKAVSPTLSSDLMPPSEPVAPPLKQELVELDFSLPPPQSTVDPRDASFSSPADSPQPEPLGAVPDLTQHPAAVLCDLPCQSGAAWPRWTTPADPRASLTITLTASHLLLATMASTASSLLVRPLAEIFRSLRTGCPLSMAAMGSAETLLALTRWLISTPTNPLSLSAETTTTPSSARPRRRRARPTTFRIRLLRRLLACSPALARPLRDATGRALRLMSSGEPVSGGGVGGRDGHGSADGGELEFLMTMLWAIDSIERANEERRVGREDPPSEIRRLRVVLDELFPGHHPPASSRAAKVRGGDGS